MHRVQLWALDDPAVDAVVEALDAADEGPGYACPWGHGVPARYVSVWAPRRERRASLHAACDDPT